MASSLARYDFLTLALLFLAPGAVAWALRPDLRPWMWRSALAALPFALTERFFYPTYWSPRFLFDLITKIGFGLEDLIFLAGLASFTTTAYPLVFRRAFAPREPPSRRRSLARAVAPTALALGLAWPLVALGTPIIYASVAAMAGATLAMLARRPDLARPSLLGGLLSTAIYAALCLLYGALLPGVFQRVWHTDQFLDRFVLGLPLEELLYGWAAGSAASAFVPFAFGLAMVPKMPRPLRAVDSHNYGNLCRRCFGESQTGRSAPEDDERASESAGFQSSGLVTPL
ncbi:MAG TPA: lycopene cyclase domain-containing protein [Polyangiaceae bacterium]|nr:lycopene cyclase domain-containing protein [Polyangiaceae bacterium]